MNFCIVTVSTEKPQFIKYEKMKNTKVRAVNFIHVPHFNSIQKSFFFSLKKIEIEREKGVFLPEHTCKFQCDRATQYTMDRI